MTTPDADPIVSQPYERLLRIKAGTYATADGRFYAERARDGWCVCDAQRRISVERTVETLRAARAWMTRRRRVKP